MERAREERLRRAFGQVADLVERRWGVPVVISDVNDPFTGDLDGAEIQIDYDQDVEAALFLLVHLFGHTVQWNLSASARRLGTRLAEHPSDEEIEELCAYEREGARYSLKLLHEAGIHDLDQWLADFSACDLAYLRHFYREGEKRPFLSFWVDGTPPLSPLPIPPFQPTRWRSRSDGIVV